MDEIATNVISPCRNNTKTHYQLQFKPKFKPLMQNLHIFGIARYHARYRLSTRSLASFSVVEKIGFTCLRP